MEGNKSCFGFSLNSMCTMIDLCLLSFGLIVGISIEDLGFFCKSYRYSCIFLMHYLNCK